MGIVPEKERKETLRSDVSSLSVLGSSLTPSPTVTHRMVRSPPHRPCLHQIVTATNLNDHVVTISQIITNIKKTSTILENNMGTRGKDTGAGTPVVTNPQFYHL